jgi:NACHT domain- and WD repeat-containing protein
VSGSDDKTIIVWETLRGLALTSLQLHVQVTRFDISLECSRILVHLTDNPSFPIICLHNSPAQYIKLPTYSAPARDVEGKYSNMTRQLFSLTPSPPDA